MIRRAVIALALGLMAVLFVCPRAEASRAVATVDRTGIGQGESFNLTVTISEGSGDVDESPLEKDFRIVSRSSGTNVSIINSKMTRETRYTYVLIPLKEGEVVLPALTVRASDGDVLLTKPIVINVGAGGGNARAASSRDVFMEASASNKSPYAGESAIYTLRIYRAVEIANAALRPLEFGPFHAEQLKDDKSYTKVIDGRQYAVIEMNFLLTATAPGRYVIPPAEITCDVVIRRGPRSAFDGFFGMGTQDLRPMLLRSAETAMDVKPLPPYTGKGRFSGLVGKFGVSAALDRQEVPAGESATLAITVRGTGNVMDVALPELGLPDTVKVYTDSPEESIAMSEEGYRGHKLFKYALVPLGPGRIEIPPVEIVYFDTGSGKHVSTSTGVITLSATKSEGKEEQVVSLPEGNSSGGAKRAVEFQHKDILPLKGSVEAMGVHGGFSALAFSLLMIAPAIVFCGCLMAKRLARRSVGIARQMADKALSLIKDPAMPGGFADCHRALVFAVLSRAGRTGEVLTYDEAREILLARGFDPARAEEVVALMRALDAARYSGAAMADQEKSALCGRAAAMVREVIG